MLLVVEDVITSKWFQFRTSRLGVAHILTPLHAMRQPYEWRDYGPTRKSIEPTIGANVIDLWFVIFQLLIIAWENKRLRAPATKWLPTWSTLNPLNLRVSGRRTEHRRGLDSLQTWMVFDGP